MKLVGLVRQVHFNLTTEQLRAASARPDNIERMRGIGFAKIVQWVSIKTENAVRAASSAQPGGINPQQGRNFAKFVRKDGFKTKKHKHRVRVVREEHMHQVVSHCVRTVYRDITKIWMNRAIAKHVRPESIRNSRVLQHPALHVRPDSIQVKKDHHRVQHVHPESIQNQ